jgi:hypothetical protein
MGTYLRCILIGLTGISVLCFAQEEAAPTPEPGIEIQKLIDSPTAGCLKKGQYNFELHVFPQGGVLAGFAVGLFDRFTMGVSYGGIQIIGSESVEWNEQPGVLLKYRLLEESFVMPAVTLGFTNQGHGAWVEDVVTPRVRTAYTIERYTFKAKGMFAVAGKNFEITSLGTIGFHAGVTYNTIEDDDDKNIDAFLGLDKSLNEELTLLAEYDLGTNDNGNFSIGKDRGYLHASLRWTFANKLAVELLLKDILNNSHSTADPSREIRIMYTETF